MVYCEKFQFIVTGQFPVSFAVVSFGPCVCAVFVFFPGVATRRLKIIYSIDRLSSLRFCVHFFPTNSTLCLRKNVTLFIFVTSLSDFIRFC